MRALESSQVRLPALANSMLKNGPALLAFGSGVTRAP